MESNSDLRSEKEERRERAKDYLDTDLSGQRGWYSDRASTHKAYAHRLGLLVIVCGSLVVFVAALKPQGVDTFDVITATLGIVITVAQGILRIWRYDETWIEYRKASERMKREQRLYVNACGTYAVINDEEQRYKTFVETTESIIAEEQQLYFEKGAARQEKTNHTTL
jgi:hypothetical protein